jgi:predicted porin
MHEKLYTCCCATRVNCSVAVPWCALDNLSDTCWKNKTLFALAVLTASGISFAQSSVTLFGVVDAGYASAKTGAETKNRLVNSGYNSSRIGFRGTEDLGGGLKASFWLEAGVNNDDGSGSATNSNNQAIGSGTSANLVGADAKPGSVVGGSQGLTFNRRSTVSLEGSFGEIRLGRDYTPQFWNHTFFDPFGTNGIGSQLSPVTAAGITAVRASNSIGYISPKFNGLQVQLQTYLGETGSVATAATTSAFENVPDAGNGNAIRVTYDAGALSLAVATAKTTAAVGTDITSTNYAGSYNFGVVKLMASVSTDEVTGQVDTKGYVVGATAPLGSGSVRFAMSETKKDAAKSNKTAIGYVYGLSKRTDLYATYAYVKNEGGAKVSLNGTTGVANTKSSGYDFGIKHSF